MTMSPIWQTWLFAITATASIAVMTMLQPNLTVQILLLVPFVAIFGLPHGALDLPIAQAIWPLNGWQGTAYFVALYLGLAGAVILAWTYFPGFSLFAFITPKTCISLCCVHTEAQYQYHKLPVRPAPE